MHIYLYPSSEPQDVDGIPDIDNGLLWGYIPAPEEFYKLDEFFVELRKLGVTADYFEDFYWSREHVSFLAAMIDRKVEELVADAEIDANRKKNQNEYPLWQLKQQKDPLQTNHLTQIVREAQSKESGLIGLCD